MSPLQLSGLRSRPQTIEENPSFLQEKSKPPASFEAPEGGYACPCREANPEKRLVVGLDPTFRSIQLKTKTGVYTATVAVALTLGLAATSAYAQMGAGLRMEGPPPMVINVHKYNFKQCRAHLFPAKWCHRHLSPNATAANPGPATSCSWWYCTPSLRKGQRDKSKMEHDSDPGHGR